MTSHRVVFAFITAALVMAGCGSEPPPPPDTPAPTPTAAPGLDTAAINARERQRIADSIAAAEAAMMRAREMVRTNLTQRIHFDYDEFALTTPAREILRGKLDGLRCNASVTMRIEGHADERGSTEYNLVLGNNRAQAAKDFLVSFGVAESRLSTTSLGEERPLVNASNESAWAQNRRAEFLITAGGDNLMPCG